MMGHEPIAEALARRRRRRAGRPRHRHRGRRRLSAHDGHAGRSDVARRQDRRVRRAVHHQPPRRRRPGHHRRRPVSPSSRSTPPSRAPPPPWPRTCSTRPSTPIRCASPPAPSTSPRPPTGPSTTGASAWRARRFEVAAQHTIKLEGARITGYETMSFTAIRDPHILGQITTWAALLRRMITEWVGADPRAEHERVRLRHPPLRPRRRPRGLDPDDPGAPRGRRDAAGARRATSRPPRPSRRSPTR